MKNGLATIVLILVVTTNYSQEAPNCYTLENFNTLKTCIEKNGEATTDTESQKMTPITSPLNVGKWDRSFRLEIFENRETIIISVVNVKGENPIYNPSYTISNQNGKITADAYASRFDTDQDITDRQKDWCEIIRELIKTQ